MGVENFNISLPTKSQLGLGNVDNTSDVNKPVSNAQNTINGTLATAISTEITDRTNADQNLQDQIDNLPTPTLEEVSNGLLIEDPAGLIVEEGKKIILKVDNDDVIEVQNALGAVVGSITSSSSEVIYKSGNTQYKKEVISDPVQIVLDSPIVNLPGKTGNKLLRTNADLDVVSSSLDESDVATITYVNNQISSAVVGLLDDRGNYNASVNLFPSSGGSGTAGAILKGDLWTISVAGTLNGVAVTVGDVVRALSDTPGQTASNWVVTENNIGYVAENSSNKSTSVTTDQASNTKYPSVKSVYDWGVGAFQTLSSFASDVRAVVLTGFSTATSSAILATDTILVALGKAQAQINTNTAAALTIQSGSRNYAVASGTDTYTISLTPTLTAYGTGNSFKVLFTNSNTGASTMNPDTLGAKPLKKAGGAALESGDIIAGTIYTITYDGTNYQIDIGIIGKWYAYVPTFTGFSVNPTVTDARYCLIGKQLTFNLRCTGGTSNSTAKTVALPVGVSNGIQYLLGVYCSATTGGTSVGYGQTADNSASVTITKDYVATPWNATTAGCFFLINNTVEIK